MIDHLGKGCEMDLPVGILTFLRKICESAGRPGPRQVQRILFVKFAEQGSTVLAYPAICRAIEMVGRKNVYFVVFEDNRFILEAMKIIPEENVVTIATNSLFGLATGALRAVLQVRNIGIDAVVDMEFLTRFSAILTFMTGALSASPKGLCVAIAITFPSGIISIASRMKRLSSNTTK